MKFEIVSPEVLSTTSDLYHEIAEGVFQRERDHATLIVDGDGEKAVIVSTDICGID